VQTRWQHIRTNTLFLWKMFTEKNTVNSVQECNHNSDVKVRQEKLLQCKDISINCVIQYIKQNTEVHCIWMFVKCCKSLWFNIKYSDESLQAQINRYNFATNYRKDTYYVKWHEKKSNLTAESEWEKCI